MDRATAIGFFLANGLIAFAIGSAITIYLDVSSLLIVVGGTLGALLLAFPFQDVKEALRAARLVISPRPRGNTATVDLLARLSKKARRDGLLSLEAAAESTDDEFLAGGLRMMVDGQDAASVESVLFDSIEKTADRHARRVRFWESIATYGPGMGLIGTLIGLVKMLDTMGDDPLSIGPSMALALLTTLYGAYIANVIGTPIATKLRVRSEEEIAHKELVASGLLSILSGENPRFMVERLNASLAPQQRLGEEAA
jgi:chemotaxis protein MotA